MVTAGSGYGYPRSTIGLSTGKWYFEAKASDLSGNLFVGIVSTAGTGTEQEVGNKSNDYGYKFTSGAIRENTVETSYGNSLGTSDILGVGIDLDNNKLYFSKNGTWQNSANPETNTGGFSITAPSSTLLGEYFASASDINSNLSSTVEFNFGNPSFSITSGNSDGNEYGNFEYAPPSGYLALCTQNLATALSPTIDDGSEYFNTAIYTGTGSSHSITGLGFQPDFNWIKNRGATNSHNLRDSTRGITKVLASNLTVAEFTNAGYVTSFDSDGFSLADSGGDTNASGNTYVAWNWKANGGTTSSNTSGSITSTVQANTTAGFSIVTYTGNATNGTTVGHGLGKVPSMVVTKARTDSPSHWRTYHTGLTDYTYAVSLNSTDAEFTGSGLHAVPTSSVFALTNSSQRNQNTINYVAYCFADIEGYSKFGSYTGNGSTDGPFVYTGFKPAWLMIKNVEQAGGQWFIHDNKRETFNPSNSSLFSESSQAETANNSALDIDFLSNGWKKRNTGSGANNDGIQYIYMAFAENPFATSGGVPVTAR
jgi:hypothetical protein